MKVKRNKFNATSARGTLAYLISKSNCASTQKLCKEALLETKQDCI